MRTYLLLLLPPAKLSGVFKEPGFTPFSILSGIAFWPRKAQ